MQLRVLGTAAGGGLPQWNCACPGCAGARAHPGRRRRHASLALRAAPGRWYLVNATPDLGEQIEETPELHPERGTRRTPLAGVVLTDAELDHTLGVPRLREAGSIEVTCTAAVAAALRDHLRFDALLAPYAPFRRHPLGPAPQPLEGGAIEIAAVPVSTKRPRYAQQAGPVADESWVVALLIRETASGRTVLYAPALGSWSEAVKQAAESAHCVIIDGTFWDDEEPRRAGISSRTSTQMGHLPITGPGGTAELLTGLDARCLYTHLNNTNPLNDPDAPEHRVLAELGFEVADDGMVIDL